MMVVLHHSAELGLPPDVVDALTGPLIGRAKSATYRTLDIVGLDTVAQVVQTLHKDLKDDPWHDYFVLPHWIKQLVERGWLGQKKQQGIYKKEGSSVLVYDEEDKNYRPRLAHVSAELQSLFYQQKNIPFSKLRTSADPQAQFVWRIFRDFFHYCAYHLPAIAHTAREVDLAMRWGYGWLQGPFEIWQTAGWLDIANAINEEITAGKTMCQLPLPQWVQSAQFSGPYLDGKAFSPRTNTYEKEAKLPIYSHQLFPDLLLTEHVSEGETIFETASVRCFILDDEYPILSFKTKHNCIDKGVLEGIQEAILYAQKHAKALILWQRHGQHFSVGADLRFARQALEHHEYEKIVAMAELFQQTALKMRYATIPIIAALRGCVLGGACELSMHATSRVVAFETYMGFVEKEIGLLPGGSGCKELAVRSSQSRDPQSVLEKYFIQILQAKVSISALEAKQLGYLLPNDRVVINTDELLYVAKEQARQLTAKGYFPPKPAPISVAGKEGMEKLLSILHELKAQKNLSAHDVRIGEKVAFILSGGEVPAGQLIDEATLLSLERQAIAELIQAKETYQRIKKRIDKNKIL